MSGATGDGFENVEYDQAFVDLRPYLERILEDQNLAEPLRSFAAQALRRGEPFDQKVIDFLLDTGAFDPTLAPVRLRDPDVLGPTRLVVESHTMRSYLTFDPKTRRLVEAPLTRPVVEERLVSVLESTAYRRHIQRQKSSPTADRIAELTELLPELQRRRSVLKKDRRKEADRQTSDPAAQELSLRLRHLHLDVTHQPPHWRVLKQTYDKEQLGVVEAIERACRPMPNKPPGRPLGSKHRLPDALRQRARHLAKRLRPPIKEAKRLCRQGADPRPSLHDAVTAIQETERERVTSPSLRQLQTYCLTAPLAGWQIRKEPGVIVRWMISQHLGVGLKKVQDLISHQDD